MTTEKQEIYFDIINELCGLYTVKSLRHKEILHSKTMDALWQCRENLQHKAPDEEQVKNLIVNAKGKLAELEVFGHADF